MSTRKYASRYENLKRKKKKKKKEEKLILNIFLNMMFIMILMI